MEIIYEELETYYKDLNNASSEDIQESLDESEMLLMDLEDDIDNMTYFGNWTNFENQTMIYDFEVTLSQQMAVVVIGLLIVIINLLVVTTSGLIMKKGIEPRCTYLLLGNLALVDMVIGTVGIIVGVFVKQLSRLGLTGCVIQIAIYNSTMIVSVYTVTLIAFDRFLYILYGIRYNQLVYPKRVRLMIAITWIFGILIGLLPSFGWSNQWREGKLCIYIELVPKSLMVTMAVIATIPIPIMLILYSIILIQAFKKIEESENSTTLGVIKNSSTLRTFRGGSASNISTTVSENSSSGYSTENTGDLSSKRSSDIDNSIVTKSERQNSTTTKKWKAFKIVLFTTGGYIVTWVPICAVSLLITFCDVSVTPEKCQALKSASAYLSTLSFMNCFLNPIIYAWWHNGFRKSAKRIYCRKKRAFTSWYEKYKPESSR